MQVPKNYQEKTNKTSQNTNKAIKVPQKNLKTSTRSDQSRLHIWPLFKVMSAIISIEFLWVKLLHKLIPEIEKVVRPKEDFMHLDSP